MEKKEILKNLGSNQNKIKAFLKKFGLTANEIHLYLLGLSLGESASSALGEVIGLHRSTAQYTCMVLVEKKLMTMVKKGNTHIFTSEAPEKLGYLLDRQIVEINKEKQALDEIMGDLKRFNNPLGNIPKVKYYQGVDGIINIFEDALKAGNDIYGLLKIDATVNSELLEYMGGEYALKKQKTKIKTYGLLNDNERTRLYTQALDAEHNRVSLFLPENLFEFEACMMMYGNVVCFFTFTDNNLIGIKIEDPQVKKSQFSMFKCGWEIARKLEINAKYRDILI